MCFASLQPHYNPHPSYWLLWPIILTLCVISVLGGLHSLANLHADDVDFGLTVLQHLLGRLEHLLILIGAQRMQRAYHNMGGREVSVISD